MNRENNEQARKVLAILALVLATVLVGHIVSVVSFNQKVHTVEGADESSPSYLDLGNREDSTSSWLKRDFDLDGRTVDLSAQTFDGTFYNRTEDTVASWTMTMHIQGDCFVNNAWCGTVEIHQYVGTPQEKVQTLDLRNYRLEDVELDYRNDGDLLIPLQKGDYLIYYPSEKDQELNIKAHSELTMGMIFYYLDDIDLTHYDLEFRYHRSFTEGAGFYAALILLLLWMAIFLAVKVADLSYRRAWKEMELRKSGISYMSDIYDIIYIIDLTRDELVPVYEDEGAGERRLKKAGAQEQLFDLFRQGATESYRPLMQEFLNLSTLSSRLERESLACEYISKPHGWCQARFFAMDRVENEPLRRVLFTVQNINAEKLEMSKVEERISQRHSEQAVKKSLYDSVSRELSTPVLNMISLTQKISAQTDNEAVKGYARDIRQEGTGLLAFINKVQDASKLSAGLLEVNEEEYSLSGLLKEVLGTIQESCAEKNLALKTDIGPAIPDRLSGDRGKLQQILAYLLSNSVKYTQQGSVTLSVFGKQTEGKAHLLLSVKDTGAGMREEDCQRLIESWKAADQDHSHAVDESGLGLNLANGLLELMGSRLNLISVYGEGSEFYFELEQTVLDPAPMGKLEQ
jgi:signal transduction histidine kinase